MKRFCLTVFMAAVATATWAQGAPPRGVYGCYSARATGLKLEIHIEVAPVMMFGLIDGSTYSDYDGKRGHYTYDAGTGILTLTDGSRQGWRYHKVAQWSFQALDAKGQPTVFTCPLEPKKDPLKRPW